MLKLSTYPIKFLKCFFSGDLFISLQLYNWVCENWRLLFDSQHELKWISGVNILYGFKLLITTRNHRHAESLKYRNKSAHKKKFTLAFKHFLLMCNCKDVVFVYLNTQTLKSVCYRWIQVQVLWDENEKELGTPG